MVDAEEQFDIDEYMDDLIDSQQFEGYVYEQFCPITGDDDRPGQTDAIVLSSFRKADAEIGEKLVTLKFVTDKYLSSYEKNRENLEHEINCLRKCAGEPWSL